MATRKWGGALVAGVVALPAWAQIASEPPPVLEASGFDVVQWLLSALVVTLLAACVWFLFFRLRRPSSPGPARQPAGERVAGGSAAPAAGGRAGGASAAHPAAGTAEPWASDRPRPGSATAGTTIFISYRRQDSADVTGRIYDRLVQRFERRHVFKDVDSIPLGVDFRKHLGEVVGRCDILLAVIGPQWSRCTGANGRRLDDPADFVRIEIEAALSRSIPVIPLLVGGAELPREDELPPSLAPLTYRNGIAVRPDPDFHRDMDRLIAGLETHRTG